MMSPKTIQFEIDGYEVTAIFSETRNEAVLDHIKQILLSSSFNHATPPNRILATSPE